MFSFLTPYLTYIKLGIIAAVVIAMTGLYASVAHYKTVNKTLTKQIVEVREANAENAKTIDMMKLDADRAGQLCDVRMAGKEKTISALRTISALTEGGLTNANDAVSSGNAVLDALNGMYSKAGHQGGVCKAASSGAPGSSAGQSGDVLYCFNAKQDILNLLTNKALHDDREQEMEAVLKSFQ